MKAEILSVGTELLLGDTLNTNAHFLAGELARAGVEVYYQIVVGDNPGRLMAQLEESFARSDMVITTGGLGPTYDDLTKETVAQYFNLPLIKDPVEMEKLEAVFSRLGRANMTENNRKQAFRPEGSMFLHNENGTASGIWLEGADGKIAIMLPGPPREMQPMFLGYVLPLLQQRTGKVIHSQVVHLFGIGESAVEDRLRSMMIAAQNPTIAPYAGNGEVKLRVTALAPSKEEAQLLIDPAIAEIKEIFSEYIYGVDVGSLQVALVETLRNAKLKIATAESCTGGMISEQITSVPGASQVFDCGICCYSNEMKIELLGVGPEILEQYGAVSSQTAAEMAKGVRVLSKADIGLSVTGIAGPGGGTDEKPVGLVYIGVSTKEGDEVIELRQNRRGTNRREDIRHRSTLNALFAALQAARKIAKTTL